MGVSSPLEILRSDWSRWNSTSRTKLWIGLGPVLLPYSGEGGDARLGVALLLDLVLYLGLVGANRSSITSVKSSDSAKIKC